MAKWDARQSRGYLNNNPGNIDRSPNYLWQGELRSLDEVQSHPAQLKELREGRFCVFSSAEWGIRALVKNLQAYQKAGVRTVSQMISRWAPGNENNTGAYIDAVSKRSGIGAHDVVRLDDYKSCWAFVEAIIVHECGGNPYSGNEIEGGLRLAGVVKPVSSSSTVKAAAAGGAAAATDAVISTAPEAAKQAIEDATSVVAPLAASSEWAATLLIGLKVLLVVIVVGSIAWTVWHRIRRARQDQRVEASVDYGIEPDQDGN